MNDEIEPLLARLPEPQPPPALNSAVMARIARESAPARIATDRGVRAAATSPGERFGAAWAFIGVILTAWVTVNGIGVDSAPDLTSSRIGTRGLVLIPAEGSALVLLCVGLALYLLGLFSPLRRRRE